MPSCHKLTLPVHWPTPALDQLPGSSPADCTPAAPRNRLPSAQADLLPCCLRTLSTCLLLSTTSPPPPQAEAVFAELKQHPDACAQQLVRTLRTSPSLEARALCAVLLRKVSAVWHTTVCALRTPACLSSKCSRCGACITSAGAGLG